MILVALTTLAFAEPASVGSGAIRVTGGAGAAEVGAALRGGVEGEVWLHPRIGVGGRGAAGIDGLDKGRMVWLGEAMVPLRVLGGEELSLVVAPGIGLVDTTGYRTDVSVSTGGVAIEPSMVEEGIDTSASVTAELYGRMSVLSVTFGPRVETYGFETTSATLNLGVGLGW